MLKDSNNRFLKDGMRYCEIAKQRYSGTATNWHIEKKEDTRGSGVNSQQEKRKQGNNRME